MSSVDTRRRAPAATPAVRVEGLAKAYGAHRVLTDVSLRVGQGEIVGVLGSNGAGKTTAVEIIQGLRAKDAGSVRVLGLDPCSQRSRLRHLVGSQLQSSALPDRLRVGEALRLFARLAGDVVDWRGLRDEWGLGALERAPFGVLSGGQRQRLFVALALVNRPRLVFFDELTQGLDAAARRETWELIERVRDNGTTVVLVTHFMDEAERLCDRVAMLSDGRIVRSGRPADVVADAGGPVRVRFSFPDLTSVLGLERIPGVASMTQGNGIAEVACEPAACVRVAAELGRRGLAPADFDVVRPSLEDAFVALTQGADS
jgi:ABC-2 type transport system ATP-binding protein